MKNCPTQKEKQGSEQFQNHGKRPQQSCCLKHFGKAMMAAWGETSEQEEDSQEEEVAEALMARSESESNLESVESLS